LLNAIIDGILQFPGFSWKNLHGGPPNEIPRQGGTFLYHQLYNALAENVSSVYGAMMDEMDEVRSLWAEK
jgi:hypothetical protein